ncbi:hypothetical protein D8674_026407 [Pyrus ussuriensis x Pyrus communis]|uniref:Uncharacterized protein n=1 Tax=Pyrus ussuriensis x Pyrus communis TaxID=2448454 RepID=A0A5N5I9U6_9ROSA|nr:hypothetical protein D8674_026407 [Pyrus ussuriensis x Pyrus communis]
MAKNSETTTNGTSYVEGHGPIDGDYYVAPQRTVAMPAAVAAAVVAHKVTFTQHKENLGLVAHNASSQQVQTQSAVHP